tara:strand:- start:300 stop:725 length:426 start_codon:yes stop_codon:yes gene_type:complete
MAINKDPGDTRTYTVDTTLNFDMKASATPNTVSLTAGNAHLNWAGRVANINLPHIAVAFYSVISYTEGTTAAQVKTSATSGGSYTTRTKGLTLSTSNDHAQIPGFFMAPFSIADNSISNGTVFYKIAHSSDNSTFQSITKG